MLSARFFTGLDIYSYYLSASSFVISSQVTPLSTMSTIA